MRILSSAHDLSFAFAFMAKFQLTISTDYVPNWGLYEATREIIQNAIDATVDGFHMNIDYDIKKQCLVVSSAGARLDRRVWLMGVTSKFDDDQYIGQFGEGLKLAALVLTRLGRQMTIVNGDETWRPTLEPSEVFGSTVLTVTTRKCNDTKAFTVTVPMAQDEWDLYRHRFLALEPPTSCLPTSEADILLDPTLRTSLFVKGVYVETKSGFYAGYNFHSAKTDRDRQMVRDWDVRYYIRSAWRSAHRNGHVNGSDILAFLLSDKEDARTFDYGVNDDMTHAARDAFLEKHGAGTIPVCDESQQLMAGHHGKRGVIVPSFLVKFFSGCPGMDIEVLAASTDTRVIETYPINQLTPAEQAVFHQALSLAEIAAKAEELEPVASRLEIVTFTSSNLLGLHVSGQIQISRSMLAGFQPFLAALIHELAHDFGTDGSVHHERAEGRLFAAVIDHLMKNGSVIQLTDEVLASLAA